MSVGARAIADPGAEWRAAEASGEPIEAHGEWGRATGMLVRASGGPRRRWLLGPPRPAAAGAVVAVVPNPPGLEDGPLLGGVEDALAAGLLRGGAAVVRVRSVEGDGAPGGDAADRHVDAALALAAAGAARAGDARVGLAGVWFGGTLAAIAGTRRAESALLVLVSAPVPDVMARRTPENEDDPMWERSPTLRLAEALCAAEVLEGVCAQRRPVLLVAGGVDDLLPVEHLEAWRHALAGAGRPVDAVELAFVDSLLRWVDAGGAADAGDSRPRALLAAVVGEWTARALRAR
jgi:hypothetical protein